jgi:hypothetical protein
VSQPLPLPIRVLVKGASTVVFIAEQGGPRSDFNFGRVIEAELYAAGHPAVVRVDGLPSQLSKFSIRTWESDVLGWSPDVVILHHGHYESIHYFIPRWLERHANSSRSRPGSRIRTLYRTRVLRPMWVSLAKIQSRVDRALDSTLFARKLRRVATDVEGLIGNLQTVSSPLVLVLEVVPPGRRWQSWFPGLTERTALMNDALAAAVARVDRGNVRFIRTVPTLTARLEPGEEPTPDGGHYSARAHRMLGEILGREILEWALTQPHLQAATGPERLRDAGPAGLAG